MIVFSIFIDAHANDIEKWFLNRFEKLLDMAEDDPSSYYHQFTQIPRGEAVDMAKDVWDSINYPNLRDYIEPTRSRANLILHKSSEHLIDEVFLRKY